MKNGAEIYLLQFLKNVNSGAFPKTLKRGILEIEVFMYPAEEEKTMAKNLILVNTVAATVSVTQEP